MLDIVTVQLLISSIMALIPSIPLGISTFVLSLTNQLPALVAAGVDVADFIKTQLSTVQSMIDEKRDPTQGEWDALNAAMSDEMAKLNAQKG
jgi:hypothetical protein